jgi:hypothetical protein
MSTCILVGVWGWGMSRKPSLAAALQRVTAGPVASPAAGGERTAPSRRGKKTIAGHFDPAVSRQLRELALAEESSVQELLREALNDLFAKRGRPPIA